METDCISGRGGERAADACHRTVEAAMEPATRPLTFGAGQYNFISGDTAYPLTREQRDNGGFGYEASEWEQITQSVGGATAYPLRDNHRRNCGVLLKTHVRHDNATGRPVCGVDALIDMDSDAGRDAMNKIKSGTYQFFSHGFDAKRIPGQRRYKNIFREVSLVERPAHPEARILVRCNADGTDETDDADTDTMSSSTAATTAAAAMATTTANDVEMKDNTAATSAKSDAPQQSSSSLGATGAVPAAADVAGIADFLAKAPKDTKEQVRFAYEHSRRAAELEAENARLRTMAARAEEMERREREKLIAAQQERYKSFAPLLQQGGMDVEAHNALMTELAQSEHTVPLFSALATVHQRNAEAEKRLAELEAENKRQREQLEQSQAFMGLLAPYQQPQQQHQQASAARTQQKRTVPKADTADQAPRAAPQQQQAPKRGALDSTTASLLNLDKFNPAAAANARAHTANIASSLPTGAAPRGVPASVAEQQPGGEDEDDAGGINLPESLPDKLFALYSLSEQMPNAAIPVRCSDEDYKALEVLASTESCFGPSKLNWQEAMLFFGEQRKIDKIVNSGIGYCPWRYNPDDTLRDERALARASRQQAPWIPNV